MSHHGKHKTPESGWSQFAKVAGKVAFWAIRIYLAYILRGAGPGGLHF
jgi:hypothetical protein